MRRVTVGSDDACWPWTGGTTSGGYGVFTWHSIGQQKEQTTAHRAAYKLFVNPALSDDLVVRHKCDNPICVNPKHLTDGTQQQNIQDMLDRGRQADNAGLMAGEKHPRARLTKEQAMAIKSDTKSRTTDLAKKYAVSTALISRIRNGSAWTHL